MGWPTTRLAGVFQRLANLLAAGYLAHPGVARTVLEHDQIAGEERRVGTAQVHQHAVAARHGNGAQSVTTGVEDGVMVRERSS